MRKCWPGTAETDLRVVVDLLRSAINDVLLSQNRARENIKNLEIFIFGCVSPITQGPISAVTGSIIALQSRNRTVEELAKLRNERA